MRIATWDWIKWSTATFIAALTLLLGLSSRIEAKLDKFETKEASKERISVVKDSISEMKSDILEIKEDVKSLLRRRR